MLNPLLNQALSSISFKPTKAQMRGLCINIISTVNDTDLAVLSNIVGIKNKHKVCHISQLALGNNQGRCRKTINRIVARLHNWGLIIKTYRPNKTCIYNLNPLLENSYVRRWLSNAIKAFNFFNISMLLAMGATDSPYVKNPYIYSQEHYTQEMSHEEDNRYLYQSDTSKSIASRVGLSPGGSEHHRSGLTSHKLRRVVPIQGQVQIKTLKLTRAGEIKLSPFPQQVIDEAYKELRAQKKQVGTPFRFFMSLCINLCKERNIKPDWRAAFSMLEREGIHRDASGVDDKDPYEYETLIPKAFDPTVHLLTSDNRPKTGPLSIAQPPKLIEKTPEHISLVNEALAYGAKSSKELYDSGYWAAILRGV